MYRRDHEKRKKFHEMIIPAGQPSLRSLYRDRFRAVMTLPHLMRGGLRNTPLREEVPEFRADPADHAAGHEVHNPAVAAIDFSDAGHIGFQQ